MRTFGKVFILTCLAFISIGILANTSFAQTPTQPPTTTNSPCSAGATLSQEDAQLTNDVPATDDVTISPTRLAIDETTPCVDVTFHNVTPSTDSQESTYYLCTGGSECFGQDKISDDSVLTGDSRTAGRNGNVIFRVCGDGQDKVKVCSGTDDDYFWGGHIYSFSLVAKVKNGKYQPLKSGVFYVKKSAPTVNINPNQNLTISTGTINISLSGGVRAGGENRNNYQITMKGGEGYDKEACVVVDDNGADFTGINKVGPYTILINEQVNEPTSAGGAAKSVGQKALGFITGPFSRTKEFVSDVTNPKQLAIDIVKIPLAPFIGGYNIVKGGVDLVDAINSTVFNRCQGGATYWQVTCTVTAAAPGGSCSKPIADPEGDEYRAFLKDLAELTKVSSGISFPCGKDNTLISDPRKCPSVNTAIGPIQITPQGFVQDIFTYVLTIAGFGAIIIIIYSGYTFITSRGDKEKIAGARETITSAIVGLLFIILSIVILEIIGVDILRIPGFGR